MVLGSAQALADELSALDLVPRPEAVLQARDGWTVFDLRERLEVKACLRG